jgi:ribonuclease BN (tRNA processing enzyme)
MKLVVLGSGTSIPHALRSSPGFWLHSRHGSLLLDIGPDVPHRMAQEQLDWANIDAIWVSHFHLDHFGGLAPFLFSLKSAPQAKTRQKILKVFGPHGLANLLNTINFANNYRLLSLPFAVDIIEVGGGEQFQILPGLFAVSMKTPHTRESLALHLKEESGTSFVYTSDTGFTEEFSQFAKSVDLLAVECSFRRNKPVQTHLELTEVMHLVSECAPTRVLLTHLYPEWDDTNVVADASELWSGDIVEATDGLRLVI